MNTFSQFRKTPAAAIATVLVLALAYGPMLWQLGIRLWTHSHYQYFPFVIAAFGYLLWKRSSDAVAQEENERTGRPWVETTLFVTAWILLGLSYAAYNAWMAGVSAIVLAAGFLVRLSRSRNVANLWGIWLLLWLAIPLPLNFDSRLINLLQRWSSRLASVFLDWAGVQHLMEGNTLLLTDKQLFVDEACSGIVSVMSSVACAIVYSVWRNRTPLHMVLLAAAGIVWATLMNVVRICVIAAVHNAWGVDWSDGAPHETLGLIIFSLTFLALVGTDYLLVTVLAPIARKWQRQHGTRIKFGKRLVTLWDRLVGWGATKGAASEPEPGSAALTLRLLRSQFAMGAVALVAFGVLGTYGAFGITHAPVEWWNVTLSDRATKRLEKAMTLNAEVLPAKIGSASQSEFEFETRGPQAHFGHYSGYYYYQSEGLDSLVVSCDFLFGPTWHQLNECYLGTGWSLVDENVVDDRGTNNEAWDYIESNYKKPDGTHGLSVYCNFNERGEPVEPRIGSIPDKLRRLVQRSYGLAGNERHFQVQVWTTAVGKISDEDRQRIHDLLLEARKRFRAYIIP